MSEGKLNEPTPGGAINDAQPRVGVYVCHCGGNISDVVDVEQAVGVVSRLPGVVIARNNVFMCSDPGQKLIEEDIKREQLNRIVIAACSPSLHERTFRGVLSRAGLNPYLLENANLREQVSWVSKHDPAGATDKAIRVVGAAIAKAKLLRPLEPIRVNAHPRAVVIGGGITGLRCALDLSRLNLKVSLLEQASELGGHLAELGRIYPSNEVARDLLFNLISELVADPNIEILTNAEVSGCTGCVGDFQLTINQQVPATTGQPPVQQEVNIQAGAIILATGFDHYEPRYGEYGFGEHAGVVTLPDYIRILNTAEPGSGQLSRNGQPVRSVTFIHCIGSRQLDGVHEPGPAGQLHHYCSRVCCTAALWAAKETRDRYPALQIHDIYQDIRTYGRGHEDYYEYSADHRVLFFRFDPTNPPVVSADPRSSELKVNVKDILTFGEELELPSDLVVLVTGMVPHAIDGLVEILKLPRSADGFLQEVHPKLRPVELSVAGVLIAGTCQAPMDSVESCASAAAAAAKAATILGKGYIELDPFVATVDTNLCAGHGACVAECSYSHAISLVETQVNGTTGQRAQVNSAICSGCGMCAAVCPTGAIQVEGWRNNQFEAMVDALISDYDKVVAK